MKTLNTSHCIIFPGGRESEKLKKRWKYGAGAALLKRGEAGTFPN